METRIRKAIKFFRIFSGSANKELYKKSVLKFCDLVEEYLDARAGSDTPEDENLVKAAEEIFDTDATEV